MTIKDLNKKEIKETNKEFLTALATGDESVQEQAMENWAISISEYAENKVRAEYAELANVTDTAVLNARGIHTLTAEETKFYNDVERSGGFEKDTILPKTIIERVFEDLQQERPLLKLIKFNPGVAKKEIIRGRRKGVAVWGPLHKSLEGQLDAEFGAQEYTQYALTAFFLISNDTLELGARWIDRYVRICLAEAIAEAWEKTIVSGTGNNQPIGLLKDLDGAVTGGVYADKTSEGTLTFADAPTMVKEMSGVLKTLSKYTHKISAEDTGEERYRKVSGNVFLIVNPSNYYDIVGRVTTQNANGVFVSNLPFISQDNIIESLHVPENKLIAFVGGEYDAEIASSQKVYEYRETFAMKRATLYATDLLGNGRPVNNDAAKVYDINIPS